MTDTVRPSEQAAAEPVSEQRWLWWAMLLVGIGLAWRFLRYGLQFPIWGDETMLAVNFIWHDYEGLTQRLDNCQIAPILFLWGELTVFRWLGASELSLRLLPLLAGLVSLFLFWKLTGLTLKPRARLFAVGFLAVAIWPVSMCSLVKPYSFDLCMSLALLLPAVKWLQNQQELRWLIVLILVTPIAMLGSYPAAFVAGGVALALLVPAWKQGWPSRAALAGYGVVVLASFAVAMMIGARHMSTPISNENTESGMIKYWRDFFPPGEPLRLIVWLLQAFSGQMFAYPGGDAKGGSALTLLFFLCGIVLWRRTQRPAWLVLFLSPFLLSFVAAAFRRYPFGGSCRLAQHLAPSICLFAGAGLAWLIERARNEKKRTQWTLTCISLLAIFGIVGSLRDIIRPYRDEDALWGRHVMQDIRTRVPQQDPVIVEGGPVSTGHIYMWYWSLEADRVCWNSQVEHIRASGKDQAWGFSYGPDSAAAAARMKQALQRIDPSFELVESVPYSLRPTSKRLKDEDCALLRFRRAAR